MLPNTRESMVSTYATKPEILIDPKEDNLVRIFGVVAIICVAAASINYVLTEEPEMEMEVFVQDLAAQEAIYEVGSDPNEVLEPFSVEIEHESTKKEEETHQKETEKHPEKEMSLEDARYELEETSFEKFNVVRRNECVDPSEFIALEVTLKKEMTAYDAKGGLAVMDWQTNLAHLKVSSAPGMPLPRTLNDYKDMTLVQADSVGDYTIRVDMNSTLPVGSKIALMPSETVQRTISWFNRPHSELTQTDIQLAIENSMTGNHDYWNPQEDDRIIWQNMHFMTTGGGATTGQMFVHLKGVLLPNNTEPMETDIIKAHAQRLLDAFFNNKKKTVGTPEIEWKVSSNGVVFHLDGTFKQMKKHGFCKRTCGPLFRELKNIIATDLKQNWCTF